MNSVFSETPPYGHLGNTVTSLLRPIFFLASWQNGYTFSWKKTSLIRPPVNTAKVFGPLVTALTGFHCKKRLQRFRCWLVLHYKEKYVVQRLRETWKSFVERQRKRDHFIGEMLTHSDYGVRFIGRVQKRICDFRWILNYQNEEVWKRIFYNENVTSTYSSWWREKKETINWFSLRREKEKAT